MQDVSSMSDAELLAALGQPAAQQQAQQQQAAPMPRQGAGGGNLTAEALFPALVQQESRGRAGAVGPDTQWGNALGRTQMLPATAREMAQRVGVPFDESLLRGTSPEAAAYQDRLGMAYLQEGFERTGNPREALMYYHGGPDRRLWGPKTRAYADEVLARQQNGDFAQVSNGSPQAPADDFGSMSDEALMAALQQQSANPQFADPSSGAIEVTQVDPREEDPQYQRALLQENQRANVLRDAGVGPDALSFSTPLNDEMAGAVGYLSQGAGNLGRQLMGKDIEISAADRARAATDVYRQRQDIFAQANPAQAATGAILGGMAFAPARAAGAMAPAQNFLRSSQAFQRPTALQGLGQAGAIGGAYGAADAEGGAGGRFLGGATGAGLGVATAGLIDGIGGTVARMGAPRVPAAERRVGQVIDRELRSNRVNPQDLLSSMNSAPNGALPFNANDGALASVAEVLASNPGPGGRIVRQAVDTQRAGSGDRILSRVGTEIGGEGNYFATLNNSIETRRQAANQVIDQIGPQQFRLNDNAVRSLRSDLAQGQVRQAAQNALASPDQQTYEMGANLMRLADTLRDNPSAATLDVRTAQDLSKSLLDMSNDAWRRGDGGTGQALGGIGRAVRNNAREAVPEYGNWLQRYGDESSQIEALETGRRIFRNADDPSADGMSAEVLRTQFNEMSDTAKDMFRKGVGEALVARARTSRGGVGAMRDLVRSDEFADRVRIAFPDEQAFTRFLNAAEAEVGMANTGAAIAGNSRTAPRQAAARRLGAQDVQQGADQLSQATLTGIPLAMGRAGLRAGGRMIGRSRSVLENDNLNELLGRAITDPALLRQMLTRPARRGLFGGRAPAALAGSAPQAIPGF